MGYFPWVQLSRTLFTREHDPMASCAPGMKASSWSGGGNEAWQHWVCSTPKLRMRWSPPAIPYGLRFSPLGLFLVMAMKMAVEEINNGSALLPGLRLGYDLFDTCSEPVVTMKPSLMFLAKVGSQSIAAYCNYTQYQPRVLAVIGPHSSELALITGKFFSFFLMPQVSPPPLCSLNQ